MNGTGTFGGAQKYVYIYLRKDGDTWKIIGIEVNNNAPPQHPLAGRYQAVNLHSQWLEILRFRRL
ncbi:MAG: hypothetical protein GC179_25980 [Anaerolineaceae bacterium]|nr:hypothetical protein [Anaerolineaceae bacterium]